MEKCILPFARGRKPKESQAWKNINHRRKRYKRRMGGGKDLPTRVPRRDAELISS